MVFGQHLHLWMKGAKDLTAEIVKIDDIARFYETDNPSPAQIKAAKVLAMLSFLKSPADVRVFQALRFHSITDYVAINSAALKREFIMISTEDEITAPPELLYAIHEAFLDHPLPDIGSVSLSGIILRAKEMAKIPQSSWQ